MYVSPPITVLTITAAMVAGAVWYVSPQCEVPPVAVMLPSVTYQTLALLGKEHAGAEGHSRTVAQIIEQIADEWDINNRAAAKRDIGWVKGTTERVGLAICPESGQMPK